MPRGQPDQSVDDSIHDSNFQLVWQHEREERGSWLGAHRREIAEIDSQRPMPDGIWWHESPIEMNPFNLCVGGQHIERAALWPNHRCVVAWTNENPGRRGKARGNARDERVLADV